MQNQDFRASSGNALWFILIAIALLAALSLTLTRNSSKTASNLDTEEARIVATKIARQLNGLAEAVQRLQSVNGCSESEISFESGSDTPYDYVNPNAPTAGARAYQCHVFRVEGAGLNDETLPTGAQPPDAMYDNFRYWYFTAGNSIPGVGPEGATETTCASNCAELTVAQTAITEPVCRAYNKLVGIDGIPEDTDDVTYDVPFTFKGTYYPANTADSRVGEGVADATTALYGKQTACFLHEDSPGPAPQYIIYKVLIAR